MSPAMVFIGRASMYTRHRPIVCRRLMHKTGAEVAAHRPQHTQEEDRTRFKHRNHERSSVQRICKGPIASRSDTCCSLACCQRTRAHTCTCTCGHACRCGSAGRRTPHSRSDRPRRQGTGRKQVARLGRWTRPLDIFQARRPIARCAGSRRRPYTLVGGCAASRSPEAGRAADHPARLPAQSSIAGDHPRCFRSSHCRRCSWIAHRDRRTHHRPSHWAIVRRRCVHRRRCRRCRL